MLDTGIDIGTESFKSETEVSVVPAKIPLADLCPERSYTRMKIFFWACNNETCKARIIDKRNNFFIA